MTLKYYKMSRIKTRKNLVYGKRNTFKFSSHIRVDGG